MKKSLMLAAGLAVMALAAVEPITDENGYMVNADEVLTVPPVNDARIGMVNGALGVILNGEPFGSCGFSSILQRNLSDRDIADMMQHTGFRINYLIICLGEDRIFGHGLDYGSTWLDEKTFDWTPVDRELERIRRLAPDTRLILKIDFDGARWWTRQYPEFSMDVEAGLPDYIADQWKADARDAVRQMIAHIQSSPYADMVIGYTLFNGASLDCSWPMNLEAPEMLRQFREFLRKKYATDAALQAAWRLPEATFENAAISLLRDPRLPNPFPLLHSPFDQVRMDDSREFVNFAWLEFLLDFARNVKEATQGRALVGIRTGNMFYGYWIVPESGKMGSDLVTRLLESPDIDFFDQWTSAFGRYPGVGDHGGPVMPTKGLEKFGKMVFMQNDTPTHQNNEPGYGATTNLEDTISMQRRIFASALTKEMYPYLWQMSSNFNVPEMMPEYRKMEEIFRKSMKLDRGGEAAIAFVTDKEMDRYLGADFELSEPARGVTLLDYPRLEWGRAGVGYDMIYLDNLEDAGPYRIYVFVHTLRLSDAEIAAIHQLLARNRSIGVFCWADGLIDGEGRFSLANMEKLTGMKLQLSEKPRTWEMRFTEELRRLGFGKFASHRHRRLGLSEFVEPSDWTHPSKLVPPCIQIADPDAVIWGTHYDDGAPVLGMKKQDNWTSVYSASPILVPELLQVLVREAGAFQYLDGDDALYLNKSFIGVHTRPETREIKFHFPEPTALYDLFSDVEYPPAERHVIPVAGRETYLFFRGSRAAWDQL